jgi:hypothetical protein
MDLKTDNNLSIPSVKEIGEVARVSREVVRIKINNRKEISSPFTNPSWVIFKKPN